MRSSYYHLPSLLWRCLSLAMMMKGKVADDRFSTICKQNQAIYDVILQKEAGEMIQRVMMVEMIQFDHFVIISLRSCSDTSRWLC